MKKILASLALLAVVTVGLVVWGFSYAMERSNVHRVIKEQIALQNRYVEQSKNFSLKVDPLGEFSDGLRRISLDGCPQDFSEAFLGYVQKVERFQSKPADAIGLLLNFGGTVTRWRDESSRIQDANNELERVALRYGTQIVRAEH